MRDFPSVLMSARTQDADAGGHAPVASGADDRGGDKNVCLPRSRFVRDAKVRNGDRRAPRRGPVTVTAVVQRRR
ncbi:hypothetical protein [Lysobacter gummosus]|uniref:hypothetical protein n=1 Tax=Lysobacter gummosus TaxID=262324 RepID=UPI0036254B0E